MRQLIKITTAVLLIISMITCLSSCSLPELLNILSGANHEHSWDNWIFEHNDTSVDVICTICDEIVMTRKVSKGLEISDGVLLGIGNCTDSEIIVPKEVEVVGTGAFKNNTSITGIFLPSTVIALGTSAFEGCSALTVINIPEGVRYIDESVFKNCSSLVGVLLPETLASLGRECFGNCPSLVTVYYKGNDIGWANIDIDPSWSLGSNGFNKEHKDFGKNCEHDWSDPKVISKSHCYLPEELLFRCKKCGKFLRHVKAKGCNPMATEEWTVTAEATCLSYGVREKKCFCGLSGVHQFTSLDHSIEYSLNDNIVSAFCIDCNKEVLSCDYIEGSQGLAIREGTVWGPGTCTDTDIVIPSYFDGYAVKEIRYSAFESTNITSVTIPDSVFMIGDSAFSNCDSLKTIIIGNNLVNIDEKAFAGSKNLETVVINSDKLKSIGENAFYQCPSLKSINLSDTLTYIGDRAFDFMSENYVYNEYEGGLYIGNESNPYLLLADIKEGAEALTIPDGTKLLYNPDIIYDLFHVTELSQITVSEGNEYFSSVDGNLYSKDKSILIKYANGKEESSFTVPSSVKEIAHDAFSCARNLESVIIPEGVTVIDNFAFDGCWNLANVSLPNSLIKIGAKCFNDCGKLKELIIPNGVTHIGTGLFFCSGIEKVTLPSSLEIIGYQIFRGCYKSITIQYEGTQKQWHKILKPASWHYQYEEAEKSNLKIFFADYNKHPNNPKPDGKK